MIILWINEDSYSLCKYAQISSIQMLMHCKSTCIYVAPVLLRLKWTTRNFLQCILLILKFLLSKHLYFFCYWFSNLRGLSFLKRKLVMLNLDLLLIINQTQKSSYKFENKSEKLSLSLGRICEQLPTLSWLYK